MDKAYDHKKHEREIYKKWEGSGAFKPGKEGKQFTVLMPPPNANASLHAGHAMYTIDDIVVRWKRMQGFSTVWIPGTDHAGFETQYVYEKELAKQGKSRMDFDRKTLYENIYKFVKDNSGLIYKQFKQLGFSADWERSVFTLDEKVLNRVWKTFMQMEKEGKVYRDEYIVNYCTHCGTSLAELEVVHEERTDPLYYIKYGPFELATVRPETKFGDTGVAVHPKDKRYTKFVGQEIEVEGLLGKFKVRVIADEMVDPDFGTGVVKVTPAHDPNDFEMGKRHGLSVKQVIGIDGRLNELTGRFQGLKVAEAKKQVVEELQKAGLMIEIDENYKHSVALCYKCRRVLEPMVMPNWFIRVDELKKPVIKVVENEEVKFFPKRFKKQMLQWLKIMHDWPISRQIAWGVKIPVWYEIEPENDNIYVWWLDKNSQLQQGVASEILKRGTPLSEIEEGLQRVKAKTGEAAPKYKVALDKPGENYLPETDTFDTWFSSGQWPLVTLSEEEYAARLPTDFMGTLEDILKFWISRMIMFSLYLQKVIPYRDVYLWSMVADAKGVKMSKSKGNVVNPIELVDKFGADALRMAMIFGVAPGSKIPLSDEKVKGMRNFANKIWNMGRFIELMFEAYGKEVEFYKEELFRPRLALEDMEIIKKLTKTVDVVNRGLEKYRFADAAEAIYEFLWHQLADVYIEKVKKREDKEVALSVVRHVYLTALKLLHPFMPFVTEAVWSEIKDLRKYPDQMLITSRWPV
ncbi:MAG: Valine-tRNA ligase [Candidatus Amesbacteria bacterium GW2011_GWB1_47_19]|nr:MAG: Valine-tRNA ligase [Candidatus Amesbacteria bacterium GW2011_GWA1_44_24]KKU32114.1 MAG: Valine-tRNA ligase [Candidatus Amesbacteria bacterium GW2011_GWC1_46_24]KKU67798.1 MAG: Valine-tRNA ligase [Candidatus Amesbacteria bacterium GW2011_GWB1_47_19]OGD06017.1 MAG: valine--tRNA ligase [Candidatus Amesbacteria bacterium RIFOXYB1_FULL_47_13]HBC72395.1 valine--tRNA ligase [Candidatus Amesbacteria bacterium]